MSKENLITKIPDNFFSGRDDFEILFTQEGVNEVGLKTFKNSENLISVIFKDNMTLNGNCFENSKKLKAISIDNGKLITLTDNGYQFSGCTDYSPNLKLINNSIPIHAFYESPIRNIDVPDNINLIFREAFNNCKGIKSIKFSKALILESGCENIFDVTNVPSVTIPYGFKFEHIFDDSENPDFFLIISGNENGEPDQYAINCAIKYNYNYTVMQNIPDTDLSYIIYNVNSNDNESYQKLEVFRSKSSTGITSIPENYFYSILTQDIYNVKEAIIKSEVTGIGDGSFQGVLTLEKVILYDVINIGDYAFYRCNNLKEFIFNEGLISIGQFSFSKTTLPNITFPSTLATLDLGAFTSSKVVNINFQSNVTFLNNSVFATCSELISINMLVKNKYINLEKGQNHFTRCTKYIPDLSVFDGAGQYSFTSTNFYGKELKIPNHFKYLKNGCFKECYPTKIILPDKIDYPESFFSSLLNNKDQFYFESDYEGEFPEPVFIPEIGNISISSGNYSGYILGNNFVFSDPTTASDDFYLKVPTNMDKSKITVKYVEYEHIEGTNISYMADDLAPVHKMTIWKSHNDPNKSNEVPQDYFVYRDIFNTSSAEANTLNLKAIEEIEVKEGVEGALCYFGSISNKGAYPYYPQVLTKISLPSTITALRGKCFQGYGEWSEGPCESEPYGVTKLLKEFSIKYINTFGNNYAKESGVFQVGFWKRNRFDNNIGDINVPVLTFIGLTPLVIGNTTSYEPTTTKGMFQGTITFHKVVYILNENPTFYILNTFHVKHVIFDEDFEINLSDNPSIEMFINGCRIENLEIRCSIWKKGYIGRWSSLTSDIEDENANCTSQVFNIIFSENVHTIEFFVFKNLGDTIFPRTITNIYDDAMNLLLTYSPNFRMKVYEGSYSHNYAVSKGLPYDIITT